MGGCFVYTAGYLLMYEHWIRYEQFNDARKFHMRAHSAVSIFVYGFESGYRISSASFSNLHYRFLKTQT